MGTTLVCRLLRRSNSVLGYSVRSFDANSFKVSTGKRCAPKAGSGIIYGLRLLS